MINIYEEISLVIAIRKNLFSNPIEGEATFFDNSGYCKETKDSQIYFPAYLNDKCAEDSIIKYFYSKNNDLKCIQVFRKKNAYNAVYIMNVSLYKKIYKSFQSHFRFLCYSPTFNILNDEVNTMYDIKLAFENTVAQKLIISYERDGNLKLISYKYDDNTVFYESLSKTEVIELERNIMESIAQKIKQYTVQYYNEVGEICFIGIEDFFDGEAMDIGLRIGSEKERQLFVTEESTKDDVRTDTARFKYYLPLLDIKEIKANFQRLFQYLKNQDNEKSENNTYETFKRLVFYSGQVIELTNWVNLIGITSDFIVFEPQEYD